MKFRTPSAGTVIACIALFVVLGGGAYAAKKKLTKLPKNIVKAKNIADGAVTEKKIKNGAVTQAKLAPGVGATPGYARVTNPTGATSTPAVDAANSKSVTVSAVTPGATKGEVCIDAAAPVKSISAVAENSNAGQAIVAEAVLSPGGVCSSTSEALVITKNAATGVEENADFYVTLFN